MKKNVEKSIEMKQRAEKCNEMEKIQRNAEKCKEM